jgi:hypothetical protein
LTSSSRLHFSNSLDRESVSTVAQDFAFANSAIAKGDFEAAYATMAPLAKGGDSNAQINLAILYAWGRGVQQSPDRATKWYRCAAENGDIAAQLALSQILIGKGDKEGSNWLVRAATDGDNEARYALAYAYHFGMDGIERNERAALRWLREAANGGHDLAQFELAEIYWDGKGKSDPPWVAASQSYAEAARWYLLSAEQGNEFAQRRIGEIYLNGRGVPQDYVRAYFWLNIATSAQKFPNLQNEAKILRDQAAGKLGTEQLLKAQQESSDWRPRTSSDSLRSSIEWREKPASEMKEGNGECKAD